MLLARNPVGIKPLYCSLAACGLLFATEVRMLRATVLLSAELDPACVAGYLANNSPQDPLTVHREIRSFPAATTQ